LDTNFTTHEVQQITLAMKNNKVTVWQNTSWGKDDVGYPW
jgi:hypothetical protein